MEAICPDFCYPTYFLSILFLVVNTVKRIQILNNKTVEWVEGSIVVTLGG